MGYAGPGDVAWMLVCTALVLLMTIPGLPLFYAGMVRKKNVLATIMQSFSLCALVTVVWMLMLAGYSLAFGDGNAWIGDTSRLLLNARPCADGQPNSWCSDCFYVVREAIGRRVGLRSAR